MKEFQETCSFLSGLVYLVGYAMYIIYIAKEKRSKPLWAPWLIFSVVESVALAEMWAKGIDNWQMWSSASGSWVVFAFTLAYQKRRLAEKTPQKKWEKWLNGFCLVGAAVGVCIWRVYDRLTLGFLLSLVAIAIGMIPIFVSAWQEPKSEDKHGWALFWLSCVFALLAIPGCPWEWRIEASQQVSYFLTESVVMIMLYGSHARKLAAKN